MRFGGIRAVDGASLTIESGSITGLIGPNGAGKTTLFNVIAGMHRPSSGRVYLDGDDITGLAPEKVVRRGVCYVPQTSNVFANLSVEENLEMGAFVRDDDFRPRMAEIYEMFPDLTAKRRHAAGTLSGGQRQMLALGKALMLEPRILLLDEPTAGLSPKYRGEIFEMVKGINAAGTPILIVEQNAPQALAIAHRGYVMVDGRNRFDGSGQDLLANQDVAKMFLGG